MSIVTLFRFYEHAKAQSGREDGNVTIFSIFMLMLIMAFTGAAVDIMRHEAVRSRMQNEMDRAVLAAADLDQARPPEEVVTDYLETAGITGVNPTVQVESGLNHRTVTASGETGIDTFFLRLSGIDKLSAPSLSQAEERIANVEISMVLDISGSMRFNDRMERMRPAARDFIEKVMVEDTHGVTTLNLVPFAGQVNPGSILFDYFRGERPKKQKNGNNGWGNGDQDAPGGSLCNNNAENADEGAADPSCSDGTASASTTDETFFPAWSQEIDNIVLYFDNDGDDVFDRGHKITNFPADAPRDADEFFRTAAGHAITNDPLISADHTLLGVSIKGGNNKSTRYFQIYSNYNGSQSDLGPTKNKGKFKIGETTSYSAVDWENAASAYTQSDDAEAPEEERDVNMPSSCVEIYDHEFLNTDMPVSEDFVSHFMYWDFAEDVMDWGWCPDNDAAIQYYSDDAEALKQFVTDMRMHDGTGTQYGMKYALALLDPATRSAISHLISEGQVDARFEGRPIDWHDPETEKFILLMSDGNITDQYRPVDPGAPENGEVELINQGNHAYNVMSSAGNNWNNLHAQCDLARDNGVTVFVVAFETSTSVAEELRECASSYSHFFHVQGDEIAETFDTIARQINNLRLVQ